MKTERTTMEPLPSLDEEIRAYASVGGFCRTTELAKFLCCSTQHVVDLCHEGKLKFKKPGRQYLIQRASILGLLHGEETTNEGSRRDP